MVRRSERSKKTQFVEEEAVCTHPAAEADDQADADSADSGFISDESSSQASDYNPASLAQTQAKKAPKTEEGQLLSILSK